jgi:hypothetical protein
MNGIRKLLLYMTAIAFVAFAAPGYGAAPTKKFSVDMSPSAVAPGSTTLHATIKNETPNGNSSINSLILTIPSGYTLNGTPTANWAGQISTSGQQVSMSNLSPLKPLQSFVLTLPLTVDPSSTCASSTWIAQAWTGSSFSGDTFRQVFSPPDTQFTVHSTTQVTSDLASTFSMQPPAFVTLGQTIPIAVKLTACGTGVPGTTVNVTVAGCTGACLTGTTSGTTDANGVVSFNLAINTIGTYQISATAGIFPQATSNQFSVYDGILDCGEGIKGSFANPDNVAPDQPGYSAGSRGVNKDGSACVLVPYTFTNNILTAPFDQVHLSWDATVQPNAAFLYTLNWRLRPVETTDPLTGWTVAPRPQVAWLTDGTTGDPVFIPGLACVSPRLPAPYGTLTAQMAADAAQVTITGIKANPASQYAVPQPGAPAIPSLPFPIVIANDVGGNVSTATERMTAVSIASQSPPTTAGYTGTYTITFNVTRGGVSEGMSTPALHDAGYTAMSTPLPIIPDDATTFPSPYVVNTQAHMCIAEHGFNGFTVGSDGITRLSYFTTVFDIGDGWVLGR